MTKNEGVVMKKALKIAAIVCASVVATVAAVSYIAWATLLAPLQVSNITVTIAPMHIDFAVADADTMWIGEGEPPTYLAVRGHTQSHAQ
ncbi:MAG: hypothetical protein FWE40_03690 [Oscillospiraceae bacterium]|nr:hypothetical protein [Oscillospiraceae bacterium]